MSGDGMGRVRSDHQAEAWRKGYEPTVEYGWHCLTCGKEAHTFTAEEAEALAAKHIEAARGRVQPERDWCCCLGMIGNTHYKCLGRALDLGHCRSTDCPTYDECKVRIAAMTPARTPSAQP